MIALGELLPAAIALSVIGALCAAIAQSKGRSALGWFVAGFFCHVFAALVLIFLPDRTEAPRRGLTRLAALEAQAEWMRREETAVFSRHPSKAIHDGDPVSVTASAEPEVEPAPTPPHGEADGSASEDPAPPAAEPLPEPLPEPSPVEEPDATLGTAESIADEPTAAGDTAPPPLPTPPPPPQLPVERKWFYVDGGETLGPAPESVVRRMLAVGALPPATPLWTEGLDDWASASLLVDSLA